MAMWDRVSSDHDTAMRNLQCCGHIYYESAIGVSLITSANVQAFLVAATYGLGCAAAKTGIKGKSPVTRPKNVVPPLFSYRSRSTSLSAWQTKAPTGSSLS
jgi:hypothetical protein